MKFLFNIVSFFLFSGTVYAGSLDQLPNEFTIQGYKCDRECYELKNNTGEQLGIMTPAEKQNGTYVLKDSQGQDQIVIQYTSHFLESYFYNVYDSQGRFLNRITIEPSPMVNSLFRLALYELDVKSFKSTIQANPMGTYHSVYTGSSWGPKVASLSRPIFSLSRDSKVNIIDREQLFSSLTPELFAALSTFHCFNPEATQDPVVNTLQTRVKNLVKTYPNSKKISANTSQLKAISDVINSRFTDQYQGVILGTEKIEKFVNFACDLVESHALSAEEEKVAVLYLKNLMIV